MNKLANKAKNKIIKELYKHTEFKTIKITSLRLLELIGYDNYIEKTGKTIYITSYDISFNVNDLMLKTAELLKLEGFEIHLEALNNIIRISR